MRHNFARIKKRDCSQEHRVCLKGFLVRYKQPTPGYQPPYPPRYSTSSPFLDTNHPTHPGTVQVSHSWIPTTLPTLVQYKQLTPGFPLCSSSKQDFMISKMATCMVHMRGVIRCLNSTTSGWVQQNRQSHMRLYAYLIQTQTTPHTKIYCRYQPGYN